MTLAPPPPPDSEVIWSRVESLERLHSIGSPKPCLGSTSNCKMVVLALTEADGLPESTLLQQTARQFNYKLLFMKVNRSDPIEAASPFSAKLPKAIEILRAERCPSTIFLMVDAFDSFFHASQERLVRRFEAMGKGVIWSAESWLVFAEGVNRSLLDTKARIPSAEMQHYHQARIDCKGARSASDRNRVRPSAPSNTYDESQDLAQISNRLAMASCPPGQIPVHHHRYLNAGGVIGYRDALLNFFLQVLSVRAWAGGWRNRSAVCGEAKGRRCAEQWAALRVLSHLDWDTDLNVTLDYESRLFYTADWSLHKCKSQLESTGTPVVHMTSLRSPRVHATLKALVADVIEGQPWPESNATRCREYSARCAERERALVAFSRRLVVCLRAPSLWRSVTLSPSRERPSLRDFVSVTSYSGFLERLCAPFSSRELWTACKSTPWPATRPRECASWQRLLAIAGDTPPPSNNSQAPFLYLGIWRTGARARNEAQQLWTAGLSGNPCLEPGVKGQGPVIASPEVHDELRTLCRHPLSLSFWRTVGTQYRSNDSLNYLLRATLRNESPRWLASYWETLKVTTQAGTVHPMCYYGIGHSVGKTTVSC